MGAWAGIVRVSHVGRRDRDDPNRFHADQDQVRDLEQAVRGIPGARLHLLPAELDISGGLPLEKRPALIAAVEGVERGEFDGIIVSYLSRLGRSVREQLRAWDRVEAAGGRIIVVKENLDTSTANGRMHRTILLAIAENEREQHGERFEERTRLATEAGIWQRRQTPTGYRKDPSTRRLVPDGRAPLVRRAFVARAAGRAVAEIARDLGMTTSGVRQLLANRVYLGELRVRSYVNPAAHPALIDEATWAAAQLSQPRPPRSLVLEPALLGGLVRCCGCGHVMSRGGHHQAPAYTCHRDHSGDRCPNAAAILCRILDPHVERIALRALRGLEIAAGDPDGLNKPRARLLVVEAELGAYLQAVNVNDVGAAAFADGARSRREAVDQARVELDRVLAGQVHAPLITGAAEAWQDLDAGSRNTVLRGLLDAVLVRRAGRGRQVPVGDRVRVLAAGSGFAVPRRRGGVALGIHPIVLPDCDDPRVLWVTGGEDAL